MNKEEYKYKPQTIEEIKVRDDAKDSSIILKGVLFLTGFFLLGLFIGDFFFGQTYLTPEIIGGICGFLMGSALTTIVQGHFSKKMNLQKDKDKVGEQK